MRDRLIKKINSIEFDYGEILCEYAENEYRNPPDYAEYVADRLLEDGIIVPPCKVGDTVWINWERTKSKIETHPAKVYALRFDTKKNNMRICVEGKFKIASYDGSYTHHYNGTFAWNSVGKTVFLTREEAEKALKGADDEK